jgi:ElaB/YqjD/DUF883 family membrane-anchored ribosome-binding protein
LKDNTKQAGDTVRDFIEQRPFTAVRATLALGLCIGWMSHRDY